MKKYFLKNTFKSLNMFLNLAGFNTNKRYQQDELNYKDFVIKSYMLENKLDFVPQGIVVINKYTLITLYDSSKDKNKSIIKILEEDKLVKETKLYNNAHVGGIAYEPKNKLVWITDKNGTISAYNFDDILKLDEVEPIYKKVDVSNHLINIYGNSGVAYISIYNNKIYLGNYNVLEESIMKSFDILDNGFIDLDSEKIYKVTNHIQGISFIDYKQNKYMIISSSYGSFANSRLKIYKYDDNIENYRNEDYITIIFPSMMEQIVMKNDKLLTLYESNSTKYRRYKNKNDDIIEINIKEILNNIYILENK